MYPNLRAEMARKQITSQDVADAIGRSRRATHDKIHGNSPFTLQEAAAIRDKFFPEFTIDYLFQV